jgi:hypothetical protein
MLEIIAGLAIVLTSAIVLSVVIASVYVFIGTVNGIDNDAIYEEDE